MAGPLDTRTTAQIEADNRDYLKKVKQIEEADKRAAEKRDLQIAATLKEQGKLTEEAFRTAKAAADAGTAFVGVTKQASAASKVVGELGGKIKEFGKGMIGGLVGALGGLAIGGSVQGIVAQAFAPPTDEDLRQWARLSTEYQVLGQSLRDLARAEIERRAAAENRKKGTSDADAAVEAVSHKNSLTQLMTALGDLAIQRREGIIDLDTEAKASEYLRRQYAALTGELTTQQEEIRRRNDAIKSGVQQTIAATQLAARLLAQQDQQRPPRASSGRREPAGFAIGGEAVGNLYGSVDDAIRQAAAEDAATAAAAQRAIADRARVAAEARTGTDDFYARASASEQGMASDKLAKQQEQLAAMFGESSPFRGIDLVTKGFDALSQSAAAAFDALISGSESAGAAFAKALGGMLKSDSIHAGVQVLKELAWAGGSLAFGDVKGAAMHAAAAGKWSLVAAAAGAGAAILGAGGGGGSAGAGAAAPAATSVGASAGGSSAGSSVTHNHFYADDFANKSYIDRQRDAEAQARSANGGGYGVSQ